MFARLLAPVSARGPHFAIALVAAQFISMVQPGTARGLPLVYFAQDGSSVNAVRRIDASGGNLETIQGTGLTTPVGIDLDSTAGRVYWADFSQGIQRKNLDGSGSVETLISGDLSPFDIALDVEGGKIYFSDAGTSSLEASLKRADLDGSDVETIVSGIAPWYIAIDPVADKIYYGTKNSIRRADLDGDNPVVIYSPATDNVTGIALDIASQKIYFGAYGYFDGVNRIGRMDLDGSNPAEILTGLPEMPLDLAVDPQGGELYWSYYEGIHRTSLDLSGGIQTIVSGLQGSSGSSGVMALALDLPATVPEPSTALLIATALVPLALRERSLSARRRRGQLL